MGLLYLIYRGSGCSARSNFLRPWRGVEVVSPCFFPRYFRHSFRRFHDRVPKADGLVESGVLDSE